MTITLCIIAGLVVCGIVAFLYEIKIAPLVDDAQPFLHDDCDFHDDPVDNFKCIFCDHCLKKLDEHCNNGYYFGKINEEMIKTCKEKHYFDPV